MSLSDARDLAATFAVALGGALLMQWLGFPAPFLTGPALAVSLAGLAGLHAQVPNPIRTICFLTIGLGIGTSVTPEVLTTVQTWPASFVVLGLALIGSMLTAAWLMQHVFGFDRRTAYLCAPPGHLSFVLSLAEDRGGNIPVISLVQSTRVLFLTLVLPPALVQFVPTPKVLEAPVLMPLWQFAVLLAVAFGLSLAFKRFRVPAAALLAGMAVSSATHLTEITPGLLHAPLTNAAFLTMGAIIGTRFYGVSRKTVQKGLLAGVAVTVLVMAWASAAAWVGAYMLGFPPATLLIAYAPGGLEAMAAMAVIFGLEPAFVAAHHVGRLIFLTFMIPILSRKR